MILGKFFPHCFLYYQEAELVEGSYATSEAWEKLVAAAGVGSG